MGTLFCCSFALLLVSASLAFFCAFFGRQGEREGSVDLLSLDGADIRHERRATGQAVRAPGPAGWHLFLRASSRRRRDHVPPRLRIRPRRASCRSAAMRPGRFKTWLKVKNPASPAMLRLREEA